MSDSVAALFQRLTQGVYVVGVAHGEARNAFTAAWVMQVSFDPLLLALSINPRHSSYGLLNEGRAFSINVLKKRQLDLARYFGQPASADKELTSKEWTTDRIGLPLLREALAWFECKVVGEHPAGDHVLVLGKVISGKLLDSQAEPCPIAKPVQWTAPLRCFPTFSTIHDSALGTTLSTVRVRQWSA